MGDCIKPAIAANVPSFFDTSIVLTQCEELKKKKKELTTLQIYYNSSLQNAKQKILKMDNMLKGSDTTLECLWGSK